MESDSRGTSIFIVEVVETICSSTSTTSFFCFVFVVRNLITILKNIQFNSFITHKIKIKEKQLTKQEK